MRRLIHDIAFGTFIVTGLYMVAASAAVAVWDHGRWSTVAWCAGGTLAAWLVGRFTISRPVDPEPNDGGGAS